ncbi:MAG: NAD-dependent epimerase/dehydratase family protein [Chloroflexi bacterium]|nr:NAD-dependent epimerase/dehydratase family protein [Chloroflexota bacterium]
MKTLVTGATGFLGKALARRLKSQGNVVTVLGRNPQLLAELEREGMLSVRTDLADAAAVRRACQGQEVVFHSGALSSAWGPAREFYRSNVVGTQNVIAGCTAGAVRRLVHVSTPSIYFRYEARLNLREDAPLPRLPANEYARTKLLAEAEIDRAYERGLPVITIRPRAIFGEGDQAILPRLIGRLQRGRLRIIGDGKTITDLTYVENVVDALLLCAESSADTLGKKYNITNGEPQLLWPLVEKLCQALGYEYPHQQIPFPLAMGLAGMLEGLCRLLPGQPEPILTRYMVGVLAKSTTLDISAARTELGYQPRVSVDEGFERFVVWWRKENS